MFARRERTPSQVMGLAGSTTVINLGSSNMNMEGIWNKADDIAALLTPAASRAVLGTLMPSTTWEGEGYYWLKGQGRGGHNKEKTYVTTEHSHNELRSRARWMQGDVQHNINGTEYRVITVGDKVVQVNMRTDTDGNRLYQWIGVSACPPGIKTVAREAARLLDSEKIIVGWDLIVDEFDDRVYVLEGNSCPGVNTATAKRILDAVEGVAYDS